MYRLVLYSLTILCVLGLVGGFTGLLPLSGVGLLSSLVLLLITCVATNRFCAHIFKVPVNIESEYITAFILFLIMPPVTSVTLALFGFLAAVVAMASKYVLGARGKHIFNPAALGVFIASLSGFGAAVWWVGSKYLVVFVAIMGLLFVRKVRKFSMFTSFTVVAMLSFTVRSFMSGYELDDFLFEMLVSGPLIFFGAVMLTEPLTMPPKRAMQVVYGGLVGLLFATPYHIGMLFNSPELALLVGNVFSYTVSPKQRLLLRLKEKIQMAPLVYDFVFSHEGRFRFEAGQYMEWTLGQSEPDTRGNRRFFTIASAPTETEVHLGVKIPAEASSYKKRLAGFVVGDVVFAGQVAGDFTLPKNLSQPIIAIAGGIGITPFRSMIKEIIDSKKQVQMTLFYASSDPAEFVYKDVLTEGERYGVKSVFVLSGAKQAPADWQGKTGYITREMITAEAPDYKQAIYYISGPNVMVDAYKKLLNDIGIPRMQVVTDFFPGY